MLFQYYHSELIQRLPYLRYQRLNYVISDLDVELEANGYVGFNLPNAMKLSEIRLDSDQNDALEIQYSLNGINWTTLEGNDPIGAAYVRVVNKGDENL